MKRTFIALNIVFLLLCLQGAPKFQFRSSTGTGNPIRLWISDYPSNGIDRFDMCYNLSPWLYVAYLMNGKSYVFIFLLEDEEVTVFEPSSKNGWFSFFCGAIVNKKYAGKLPEDIILSTEDQFFYENRPKDFKVLKSFHIEALSFHLTIDLFNLTVTYEKRKNDKIYCKQGILTAFYYL